MAAEKPIAALVKYMNERKVHSRDKGKVRSSTQITHALLCSWSFWFSHHLCLMFCEQIHRAKAGSLLRKGVQVRSGNRGKKKYVLRLHGSCFGLYGTGDAVS